MNPQRRAAAYVRVACAEESEMKLADQERVIRLWVEFNNLDLIHVYSDVGSGNQENRPGLVQMMEAAQANEFEILLMTSPTRLFRNFSLAERYLSRLCSEYGIRVFFVGLEGDPS